MRETPVQALGQEDPLEKEMITHYRIKRTVSDVWVAFEPCTHLASLTL